MSCHEYSTIHNRHRMLIRINCHSYNVKKGRFFNSDSPKQKPILSLCLLSIRRLALDAIMVISPTTLWVNSDDLPHIGMSP